MKTGVFEVFKIGIGPSSSHTVGPMFAARDFALSLEYKVEPHGMQRVLVELYGSLALTGKGHGTDRAVVLGLMGEVPDSIDPSTIEQRLDDMNKSGSLRLPSGLQVRFDLPEDIVFRKSETLPGHSNGMRFTAFGPQGQALVSEIYYSIGGGAIHKHGETGDKDAAVANVPYPFRSGAELVAFGDQHHLRIWEIALANENARRSIAEIREYVMRIHRTMEESIDRGLATDGILPGGLKVRRRAPHLFRKLSETCSSDPLAPMDWVNAFAMAVNEENAAGSRIVTAPTNGAAGIIPAVGRYYLTFIPDASQDGIFRYLLTAAAIGALYKENASISGAEVGCQGEVGVACSMAAAGLVAALEGTNAQVEYAAEIAMEHNLGMTCDPIGGLVQIPCIERNAMGAVKAINACRIAMLETGKHKVSLDQVITTMYQTGLDMQTRYKETALAGLALNVIEC